MEGQGFNMLFDTAIKYCPGLPPHIIMEGADLKKRMGLIYRFPFVFPPPLIYRENMGLNENKWN